MRTILERLYNHSIKYCSNGLDPIVMQSFRWKEEKLILFENDDKIDLNIDNYIISIVKRSNKNIDSYLGDMIESARLILSKTKTKRLHGYIIGANENPNRLMGFIKNDNSWFKTLQISDYSTDTLNGMLLGEITIDILISEN